MTDPRHIMHRLAIAAALLLSACGGGEKAGAPLPEARASVMLSSPAFAGGGTLPRRFTCDGAGVSPPLAWSGVPREARELTLVVEDPDAGRFVHWTVLRIPPAARGTGEGRAPRGGVETGNSAGKRGWAPACPPEGDEPHRYVFALYAERAPLGLGADASPDEVRARIAQQAIARGVLTARYGRG